MQTPVLSFLALLLATAGGAALTPTEWQHRQTVNVPEPGLTKITLPAATFDAAKPDLSDLRLLDPGGREIPYFLDRDLSSVSPEPRRDLAPKSFRSTPNGDTTELLIETGTGDRIDAIDLKTPAPYFLKAAHVEISSDGLSWESLGPTVPVFRQLGAEQLRLSLNQRTAAFVRVTLDDLRSRHVDFSGANLLTAPALAAPPTLAPLGTRITRRDEFAGETVLTVTLDGRHVPLAGLTYNVTDPLFMRRVVVSIRDVSGAVSRERSIGSGTIYRVALDGAPARTQLDVPLDFTPSTRELLVHIQNGDSPPLTVDGVEAEIHPVNLLFNAAAAGNYTLLSGNPQATHARYDLAVFSGEMRAASANLVMPGHVEDMPDYHVRESLAEPPLPDVPLTGAPLDTEAWMGRKPIQILRAGVQELELDPEALAKSLPDGADLRVLRDGKQIPYVLERTALSRSLALTPSIDQDPRRPNLSVWQIKLPQAGLPIQRLLLTTTTPLFQRQFRLFEKRSTPDGQTVEVPLASGPWSRTPEPGAPETKAFAFSNRLQGDTIWIESDNGDNPAISLGPCQVVYPVVRLVFKVADTDGFTLAYGNKSAASPQYDLSLVAERLLTASRNPAHTGSGKQAGPQGSVTGLNGGYLFWGALALVVAVLLAVVAKLLPRPPAA